MDELKKVIDLEPLSDESIKQHKYALSDLWMVKDDNNQIHGPFPTDALREYSHSYKYLFDNAKVYNLESEKWYGIFDVKHFQRRKPQLVSAQNLISDSDFYVLVNGQKNGPFTLAKMQELLNSKKITPSSQISLDNGESWIRLYEHHAFDRRAKKKNEDLPFVPDEQLLEEVKIKPRKIDEDAIVELAQLNKSNEDRTNTAITRTLTRSGIQTKSQVMKNPLLEEEMKGASRTNIDIGELEMEGSGKSKLTFAFVSIALVAGLIFSSYYIYNNFKGTSPNLQKSVKTESKSINNSDRTPKRVQRKPASFGKSKFSQKTRKTPTRIQPKRYVSKPRRIVPRPTYQEPEEPLDINDPEVQEELSRKLAGDYDDEYPNDEEPQELEEEKEYYEPSDAGYNDDVIEEEPEPTDEDPYYEEENGDYQYDAPYNE